MNSLLSSDFVNSFYNNYERKKYEECEYIKNYVIQLFNDTMNEKDIDLSKKRILDLDNKKIEVLKYKSFETCKEYDELRKSFNALGIGFKCSNFYSADKSKIEYDVINKNVQIIQKNYLIE